MFCARCGAAIPDSGVFCTKCGTRALPSVTASGGLKRPGVVTFLAILEFIGGGIWVLIGALGLVLSLSDGRAERDPSALAIFALMLALAGVQLTCGVGLWKLRPYGRRLQLITSSIGLLAIPIGTIVSIAILIYLSKPGIKLLFAGRPVESLTQEELSVVAAATGSSGAKTVMVGVGVALLLVAIVGIVAAIAVPGLLRARIAGNEAAIIRSLRAASAAESSYAINNRGYYDRTECLVRPSGCVPAYSGAAFLLETPAVTFGYRYTFYPGPRPQALPAGASQSSITSFVLMAVPADPETGTRLFCVDQTGQVRVARLDAQLVRPGASCPVDWPRVQ